MEFDPNTTGTLVVLLTKLGVTFSETFLKKVWNPEKNPHTESNPTDNNRKAAWDLYVEMETRITTQPLDPEHGDEKTALDSVYSLFQTTREILLAQGPDCVVFAKIAIEILNQKVRPFTAKWHRKSLAGAFDDPTACAEFRDELESLQVVLRAYTQTLAVLAGIEDIASLSDTEQE
ncbi:MAG: hypothetical protein OXU23_10710 [Candidatus Poribacteria bacterium]|nr:hypothetical protein [Candidatus Poribacteria bacterium]